MRSYNIKSNVEKIFLGQNKESNNIVHENEQIFTLQF